MRKAVLHGTHFAEKDLFPIFEITGVPDCGKKLVAELVAKRLGGYCVHFPLLDTDSFTGFALLHSITTHPQELEQEPLWWVHLYCANLQERREYLQNLRRLAPVIVTNYMTGARIWARAVGVEKLSGFFGQLPPTRRAYGLYGAKWETPGNLKNSFTPSFLSRLELGVKRRMDGQYTPILMQNTGKTWEAVNKAAQEITEDINKRYGLEIDEGQLYSPTLTFKK
jgi:hypothetical protein